MSQQTPPPPAGPAPEPSRRRYGLLLTAAVWLLVFLLLILAALATWARYVAENIDDYRPVIESVLSERLGQEVTIGSVSASWQGPDPMLQVSNLEIGHHSRPQARAFSLQHLLLRLDGPRSLLRLGLVFERIEADGLDLVVASRPGGGLAIDGLNLPDLGPGLEEGAELTGEQWLQPQRWLNEMASRISDPRIRLTHLTLGIRGMEGETAFVDIPQLDLAYDSQQMSASGRAMRQGTLDQLATFSIKGRGLFEDGFSGQVWADITPGGVLEVMTRGLEWRNFQLRELDANATTWLTFNNGQLEQVNGRLHMPLLGLDNDMTSLAPLEDVSARVGWRRTEEGGSLHVRDLKWRWQDEVATGMAMRLDHDRLHLWMSAVDVPVGPLVHMAVVSNLLPARAEHELSGLQPKGRLPAIGVDIPLNQPDEFEVSATLDGVSIQPHRGAPGGENLQGELWMSRHGGRVRAQGELMVLNLPELFAGPLTFSRADADVAWRLDGGITRVFARDITATYGEDTRVKGAFDLRLDRYGEDNLGLKIAVENGEVSMLPAVLPKGELDPELYTWLTTAITDGQVVSGVFFGHGQIGDDTPRFSFSTAMKYRFRDASMVYDPQWPAVTDASGTVTIHNGDTRVVLDQASTGGLQLGRGEVRVVPGDAAPTVYVDASARFGGQHARYWLSETPLGDLAGTAGQVVSLGGDYDLDLSLGVPLASGQAVSVDASLRTGNGSLHYPPADLRWQAINGGLRYSTRDGFSDDALSARFLEQPVRVRFRADPSRGALTVIQTGQTDLASLARELMPQGQEIPGVSGSLPYTARLDFVPDGDARLAVTANTSALQSQWPPPLSSALDVGDTAEALLRWPEGDKLLLEAHWGGRIAAALEWRDDTFRGGQVVIGDGSARFPVEGGLMVRAAFDRFEPARWLPLLEQVGVAGEQGSIAEAGGTGQRFDWLNSVDLRMNELILGDHAVPGVRMTARPQQDGWLLTTNSERATGQVRIPDTGDRIWVELDRLNLARDHDGDTSGEAAPAFLTPSEQLDTFRGMAAGQWPEVEVRIASLILGEDDAGSWSFVLSPSPDQVTLMDLQGRLDSLAFDGQLRWGVTSGEQMTVIQGVLEGGGLQGLSGLVGHEIPLTNKNSVIDLNIAWPGRPDQFAAGHLSGDFSIRLDDGVILENNETAQLFRVFNLLNTDTLQRRLQFDFSDLYEAGVAFDAIYGKATLDHGILSWDPDLQLAGPSGALRLSGLTNLADETLDMRLVVILPLTQNLPLAAILMGASPPVGGALFVLDKLLGEPLSKLTSATYSVGGTWDNPDVDLRNIFDSGNQE